jgi:hypothetical protein
MRESFLLLAAALLLITAAAHSLLGERRLLQPLLRHPAGPLASSSLARFVLRFAWHLTSLTWFVLAIVLLAFASQPAHAFQYAALATGVAFTAAGVFDAIGSRGRHVGWPLLAAIGVASLLAAR